MNEIQELLVGYLSDTIKTDAEQLKAELFEQNGEEIKVKDSAKEYLLNLDKTRVKTIRDTEYKNAYAKSKKEVLTSYESDLKTQFGIDSEKQGLDLINDILSVKAKPGTLTDDDVKKHPLFISREKQLMGEKESEIKTLTEKYQIEKHSEAFDKLADQVFFDLKPILPSDPKKALNQKNLFNRDLKTAKWESNGNTFIMLNADGTRMEDGHGNLITPQAYIKQQAEQYFEFQQSDKRTSGDDPTKKGNGAEEAKLTKPTSAEEFGKMAAKIREQYTDPKERDAKLLELTKLYRS